MNFDRGAPVAHRDWYRTAWTLRSVCGQISHDGFDASVCNAREHCRSRTGRCRRCRKQAHGTALGHECHSGATHRRRPSLAGAPRRSPAMQHWRGGTFSRRTAVMLPPRWRRQPAERHEKPARMGTITTCVVRRSMARFTLTNRQASQPGQRLQKTRPRPIHGGLRHGRMKSPAGRSLNLNNRRSAAFFDEARIGAEIHHWRGSPRTASPSRQCPPARCQREPSQTRAHPDC